jgi:iron complex transport system permease protein
VTATRRGSVAVVVTAAIAVLVVASASVGTYGLPPGDVLAALVGRAAEDVTFVVRELRLPRAVTGALVGAAFGTAGAVFQSTARNPLASPDIIGITAGASAAAVIAIVVGGSPSATSIAAAAAVGALATATAIWSLAWRRGRASTPQRLVLVGIGITAALTSVTSFLLTRADLYDAQRATVWLTGSLNGRTWTHVGVLLPAVLVLVPALALGAGRLRILELGDDLATGLGVGVARARAVLLLGAVVLAAVATAAAGPVGFVALAAPQVARRVASPGRPVPVLSALVGAAGVLAADLLARTALSPTELPVGVVTAVVGAPYLLWLIARTDRGAAA